MADPQHTNEGVQHATDAVHSATEAVAQAATEHPPELPNFVHILHQFFPHNSFVELLYTYINQVYIVLVAIAFAFLCRSIFKHRTLIPGRLQAATEMVFESLLGLVTSMLGEKDGRKYFPFIGSIFFFILFSNLLGIIPLMRAPTASILVTGSLALVVFLYVQYTALTRLGPVKYCHHMMGEPTDTIGWCMVPLFLPLHILEEIIKPVSLACRLFGNIFGKDILLGVGMVLGIGLMSVIGQASGLWEHAWIGIPFQVPIIFLAMLLSLIQALVFALLTAVYISMVLPHGEHGAEH